VGITWKTELETATSIGEAVAVMGSFGGRLEAMNQRLADHLTVAIEKQFEERTDPYGEPWIDGPYYNGLYRTGDMLASLQVQAHGLDIDISMDDPAIFHQKKRPIFPAQDADPPPSYEAAFAQAVDDVMGT